MDLVTYRELPNSLFTGETKVMSKPRFQFTIKALLIAVALIAVPLSFLRPAANGDAPIIDLFGPVQIRQDGSVEVQGGSVRIRRASERTEIRATKIVVQKDGTAMVYGPGVMLQKR